MSGRARELKAGEYRFDQPLNAVEVIDRIAKGDVYKRLLTFAEGLTIAEMAKVFEERGFGSAEEFARAAKDPSLIQDLDPKAPDLEGYLFPETYALPRSTPAADVVKQMVALFKQMFDADLRAAANAAGLSVRDAVTLASLVEKETAQAAERPLVAAVYRNRLTLHMPMQADPTVIYALQKAGRYHGNIRRDDLQFDSPYNTYRYPGLPPGPIASPGLAALQAAVRPADVKHLYFVSRNDGTHVFADTLAQHNRNVATWQVRFFRRSGNRQRGSRRVEAIGNWVCARDGLALVPLQLLAQHFEIASRRRANQSNRLRRPRDRHFVSLFHGEPGLAVDRDIDFGRRHSNSADATRTSRSAGMTIGRLVSVCGAIGVRISAASTDARWGHQRPGCTPSNPSAWRRSDRRL